MGSGTQYGRLSDDPILSNRLANACPETGSACCEGLLSDGHLAAAIGRRPSTCELIEMWVVQRDLPNVSCEMRARTGLGLCHPVSSHVRVVLAGDGVGELTPMTLMRVCERRTFRLRMLSQSGERPIHEVSQDSRG